MIFQTKLIVPYIKHLKDLKVVRDADIDSPGSQFPFYRL